MDLPAPSHNRVRCGIGPDHPDSGSPVARELTLAARSARRQPTPRARTSSLSTSPGLHARCIVGASPIAPVSSHCPARPTRAGQARQPDHAPSKLQTLHHLNNLDTRATDVGFGDHQVAELQQRADLMICTLATHFHADDQIGHQWMLNYNIEKVSDGLHRGRLVRVVNGLLYIGASAPRRSWFVGVYAAPGRTRKMHNYVRPSRPGSLSCGAGELSRCKDSSTADGVVRSPSRTSAIPDAFAVDFHIEATQCGRSSQRESIPCPRSSPVSSSRFFWRSSEGQLSMIAGRNYRHMADGSAHSSLMTADARPGIQ